MGMKSKKNRERGIQSLFQIKQVKCFKCFIHPVHKLWDLFFFFGIKYFALLSWNHGI